MTIAERIAGLPAAVNIDGEISFEKGSNLPATSKKAELPETEIEHGIGRKIHRKFCCINRNKIIKCR